MHWSAHTHTRGTCRPICTFRPVALEYTLSDSLYLETRRQSFTQRRSRTSAAACVFPAFTALYKFLERFVGQSHWWLNPVADRPRPPGAPPTLVLLVDLLEEPVWNPDLDSGGRVAGITGCTHYCEGYLLHD